MEPFVPTFADLGVPADLIDALDARGIVDAFDIQSVTIAEALEGRDVTGRAPTGSGKTLAFGIPLVANVERARPKRPRGLVLVPTRELAAQVARDLNWLGMERGIRVHSFYGGVGFDAQLKALRNGVDIAVACPGRLADLVNQGRMRLDGVDHVVIDEADRMADMGFLPEVKRILDQTASDRQTLLFSATLDGDVDVLVKRYQTNPIHHDVTPPESTSRITHHFWKVELNDRVAETAAIIARMGQTIVFTRTRHGADRVSRQLGKYGIVSVAIHGDRSQNQRDRALADFTSGRAQAMIATDVAARGIHVDAVACVVHCDIPADHKDYVHRSGRTGRAEAEGVVVALVMSDQHKDANKIIRTLELGIALTTPAVESLSDQPAPRFKAPKGRPADDRRPARSDRDRKGRNDRRPAESRDRRRDDERPRRGDGSARPAASGAGAGPARGRNERRSSDDRQTDWSPKPKSAKGRGPGGGPRRGRPGGTPAGVGGANRNNSGGAARSGGSGGSRGPSRGSSGSGSPSGGPRRSGGPSRRPR
jgi:superfamily II DNA/RNA helicase